MKKIILIIFLLIIGVLPSFAGWKDGGYLSQDQLVNTIDLIGAPPATDSLAFANDKAISESTFSIDKDSYRYQQAIHDATSDDSIIIADFSKAFGQKISENDTPAIFKLLNKATIDVNNAKDIAKDFYKRKRPYVYFDRQPCDSSENPNSYAYPSGHSTRSWTYGLILAQLKPQNGEAILKVSKEKAESRVICGVHWLSDIKASQTVAMSEFAVLQSNQQYKQDFHNAQKELK
ncbi:acid phosphatase [Francisella hispaniensis]|uniref:Acid phosphatase n=1 Tax=Francisella hispaniensis TaxID=622488 RepID=F4BID6_9GAMM|nr:phosphatase PAP2 family protein [Francisella hispaniensis]AEB27930.1 Phosphatase [Francisella hispaniensis]